MDWDILATLTSFNLKGKLTPNQNTTSMLLDVVLVFVTGLDKAN